MILFYWISFSELLIFPSQMRRHEEGCSGLRLLTRPLCFGIQLLTTATSHSLSAFIHKYPNAPDSYAAREPSPNNLCYSPAMCDQGHTDLSCAALSGKIILQLELTEWQPANCSALMHRWGWVHTARLSQLNIRVSVPENFSELKVLRKNLQGEIVRDAGIFHFGLVTCEEKE